MRLFDNICIVSSLTQVYPLSIHPHHHHTIILITLLSTSSRSSRIQSTPGLSLLFESSCTSSHSHRPPLKRTVRCYPGSMFSSIVVCLSITSICCVSALHILPTPMASASGSGFESSEKLYQIHRGDDEKMDVHQIAHAASTVARRMPFPVLGDSISS